ncbi:MAG: hypothetical protein CL398_08355 [Acidiferrobacteraceae bacterium]|nr:hypothetical protein [Acidiferrobacteraceae bacterium]
MASEPPYLDFAERLIDAMQSAGYGAREGSWSRIPVEIEPLQREAGAKSLTTARKYLEGKAFPRRYRLEQIAEWLKVHVEWLAAGTGPRHLSETATVALDLPAEALAVAKAWSNLPRHYREPIRSWIIMASIIENLSEDQKILPAAVADLDRRKKPRR